MKRFREYRKTEALRASIRETHLSKGDFIQPFFVVEGNDKREAIASMPGVYRYSVDRLVPEVKAFQKLGGTRILLFGVTEHKDSVGSKAYDDNGIVQAAVRAVKAECRGVVVITDVCMCGYTDHGHCGIIENNYVDNDKTLPFLGRIAVSHARAGADIVAPSDMMDFRVLKIREDLDAAGYPSVKIMSYSAKYASAYYGPFRDAANSSPQFGDRKTYQMDYCNRHEALAESIQDIDEGADYVMVKPALAYLDVVALLKQNVRRPVVAYNVSGEYSMIKAAAQNQWVNEKDIVIETLTAMKRAGADLIITYFAVDMLTWLGESTHEL